MSWSISGVFGPGERSGEPPAKEAIEALKARLGYHQLQLDLFDNKLLKREPVSLDLSAIGKGYAVDELAKLLDMAGYQDYMVEIGGEIRTRGKSSRGGPWLIAIEKPGQGIGVVQQVLSLVNVAVATSGDYRNYFEKDGKRYSHTIDPRTGYPITHNLASVTVIAETAAFADAMATALTVMGPEEGLALAKSQDMAVYMLLKTEGGFAVEYTPAFKPYLD